MTVSEIYRITEKSRGGAVPSRGLERPEPGRADARAFYERFSAAGDAEDIFREGSGENE